MAQSKTFSVRKLFEYEMIWTVRGILTSVTLSVRRVYKNIKTIEQSNKIGRLSWS